MHACENILFLNEKIQFKRDQISFATSEVSLKTHGLKAERDYCLRKWAYIYQ